MEHRQSKGRSDSAPMPCDQCRRRKIRCDYNHPCERCQKSDINCTFATSRKKRGPKKGKGAIVEQIRAQQQAETSTGIPTSSPIPGHASDLSAILTPQNPPSIDQLVSPGTELSRQWTQPSDAATAAIPTTEWNDPGSDFDASYFPFDEFAQSILSSSHWPLPPQDPTVATTWPQTDPGTVISSSNDGATRFTFVSNPLTPSFSLTSVPATLESSELIERAVDLYFSHMYPIYPIIERSTIRDILQSPSTATESEACLVWAMCALSIMHVDRWPNLNSEQKISSSKAFVRRCLTARLDMDFVEAATYHDVLTSLFLAISFFEMKQRKTSWFHTREAITLAYAAGLDRVDQDPSLEQDEKVRRQRAYALLFITERGACVLDEFPVSIVGVPDLTQHVCVDEDPAVSYGLQALYALFSTLDFNFVILWDDPARFASVDKGFPELSALQEHLQQPMDMKSVSDIQRADVLITQEWLRLIFWQAALRKGLIRTRAEHPAFTYEYPLEIATALCEIVKSLPPIAIQVHGLGIFEKQFEIAYSLLDTLTYSNTTYPVEHNENLRYLLLSLSASPSSRQIYVRTLKKKMDSSEHDSVQKKYRALAGVQLLRDHSGSSREGSRRQSIGVGGLSRR